MAFDPNNGNVYRARRPDIADGHYGLRADDMDADFLAKGASGGMDPDELFVGDIVDAEIDPLEAARREAFEAVAEINLNPASRTPKAMARAEQLSRRAVAMATEANLALIAGAQS